jgi:alanine racemase
MIAVVKADAYGHGAVPATKVLAEAGVDFFAVTSTLEALELRDNGIDTRLLVFAPPPMADEAEALIERDVAVTVADSTGLRMVTDAAQRIGKPVRVHLKVDTGMGRLGFLPPDAVDAAATIAGGSNARLEGVYTHFGRALEPDFSPSQKQFAVFQDVLSKLKTNGIDPGLRHCANSAAMLREKSMWLDAVRPGTILYGQFPSASTPRMIKLENTWQLKTRIVSVRDVPAGTAVGYGAEFVTKRASKLAVLAIGYADGFTLAPASTTSGWRGLKALLRRSPTQVTLRGKQAPVVGRVAMQMCTIDVTEIAGVEVGDVVDVPCRRLAASARIPRVYEE